MLEVLTNVEFLKWAVPGLTAILAWLINEQRKRSEIRWEIKRQACLDALKIIDGHFANNVSWKDLPKPAPQPEPSLEHTRDVYNRLCLVCDSDETIIAFKTCLGVVGTFDASSIVDLRNAIRKELGFGGFLGFGGNFDSDRKKSWIGWLKPAA